jgi:hypothetical protein
VVAEAEPNILDNRAAALYQVRDILMRMCGIRITVLVNLGSGGGGRRHGYGSNRVADLR